MTPLLAMVAAGLLVASCTATPPPPARSTGTSVSVSTLQRINTQAHRCWLPDAEFRSYGTAPELNTTGTPRLLVIPRGKPQSLPQLVVTADGASTQVYGPLATSPLAPRIERDVARWAAGATTCTA
ncbi:hypothetical protein EJC49_23455 [Aquibium carbonis]|uniref:Lipoprotein n=1 Tax=Aquibium carbonis TaxID=2495581 RepID=A0A3R9ZUZ0_9HYPH|nr:hypothetical protein [Aquibium carbonis]RST82451.1 hypothetical protein EJC49_23455 [Aquibium carbonis]